MLAVSTLNVIDKARQIDASFRNGYQKKLVYWVYDFMKRRHLSVRTRTPKIQITDATMQSVKVEY